MGTTTMTTATDVRDRWTALAAVVAALAPAVTGAVGLVVLTQWYLEPPVLIAGAVVSGVAAAAVALHAYRRRDRVTLGFAVSVLCFALGWLPLGGASFAVSTILTLASQALAVTFGVLVARRGHGWTRTAGWVVAVAAAVWLVGGFTLWFGTAPAAPQGLVDVLVTLPAFAEFVAFVTAALLFVGPLVRPVGVGARYLWSTADVR